MAQAASAMEPTPPPTSRSNRAPSSAPSATRAYWIVAELAAHQPGLPAAIRKRRLEDPIDRRLDLRIGRASHLAIPRPEARAERSRGDQHMRRRIDDH